jgi:hypothetical protein
MKLLTISILALFITSCEPVILSGNLKVNDTMVLHSKSLWQGNKKVTIPKGTFSRTKVSITNNKLTMDLTSGGKTTTIHLKANQTNIPSRSGKFTVSASSIKQKYSLKGIVNYSENEEDQIRTDLESCTVIVNEYKCGRSFCPVRGTKCCYADIEKEGTKEVEFRNVYYSRDVKIDFVEKGKVKGSFSGKGSGSYRNYIDDGVFQDQYRCEVRD